MNEGPSNLFEDPDVQFGNLPFHRLAELESEGIEDGSYESSDSQFETEPLESSSSDEDDQRSVQQRMSSFQRHVSRRRPASSASDDSSLSDLNVSEIPNWFTHGPFKYNGRVAMLAFPGMILTLLFAGEMFLGLAAVGALIICLLHSSGNKTRAMAAYLILFIVIQLTVVYSVLPLIWKSLLNIFIIFALNTYSFLTGGWILLQFDNFRFRDPDLLMLLETSLFTLYPASFVIQVTWLLAATVTTSMAPYVFMLLGFVVFQVFTSPVQSSFVKLHPQGNIAVWDSEGYVLSPLAVVSVAIVYSSCGPFLVLVLRAAMGWKTFLSLSTIVQFLFVASSSIFLATFLHLRMFMEKTGTSHNVLLIIRWTASMTSLLLLGPLLHCYDFKSTLLPWIPVISFIVIGLILATLRKNKIATDVCLALLSLVLVGMFYQLPWHLDFVLPSSKISLSILQTLLLLNAAICLVTFHGATYWSSDALGITLLIQSFTFSVTSRLLLSADLTILSLVMGMAVIYCYVSLRLYHSGRLPYQSSLVITAVHLTSVVAIISYIYGSETVFYGVIGNTFNYVATFALFYLLLKLLIYDDQSMSDISMLLKYLYVLLAALVTNIPILLSDSLQLMFTESDLTVSMYLGVIGVVLTIVYGKVVCFNHCSLIKHKYSLFVLFAVPSFGLLALHPQLSLGREELQKWAFFVSLVSAASVVPLASVFGTHLRIIGAALGLPLGIGLLHVFFPSLPSLAIQVMFGVLAVLCLTFLLTAWQQHRNANRWLQTISLWIGVCCVSLVILETLSPLLEEDQSNLPYVTLIISLMSSLLVAAVCRLHLVNDQENLDQLRASVNRLPLIGNIFTLIGLVLFVVCCPSCLQTFRYLWVCVGAPVLLLLNKDDVLFRTLCSRNRVAPVVSLPVITLYLISVLDCSLFSSSRIWSQVLGLFELITIVASTPVAASLLTMLWNQVACGPDALVVFTAPAYVVLFLLGTEYSSWVLASFGLAASYWLMKYKLQFSDDT